MAVWENTCSNSKLFILYLEDQRLEKRNHSVECCQKSDESNFVTVQCAPGFHHRSEEVTDDVASETYYFLIAVKSV